MGRVSYGLIVAFALVGGSAFGADAPTLGEIWHGKLTVAEGIHLRVVFHLKKDDKGAWTATFDSPDQGAKGMKVATVVREPGAGRLVLELAQIQAKFEGTLNAAANEAKGNWIQSGQSLPLELKRSTQAPEPVRPQTPRPPFPYKSEEVSYTNQAGGVTLAGTLTIPQGAGPFPAVILISGSGAQDRDESLMGHKPFLVMGDALTRRGIAVLRVDDRGVGGSTGRTDNSTAGDSAGDVLAGVAFLKTRPEVAPDKIGLIGHSEGGIIAPMAAVQSKDVAFVVMLAGTGLPGDQLLRLQARQINQAFGVDAKTMERELGLQAKLLDVALADPFDAKVVGEKARAAIKDYMANMSASEREKMGGLEAQLAGQVRMLQTRWFQDFLRYDPRPILARVRCPLLVLSGEKDLQVPPKQNFPEIAAALQKGGNTKVTLKELPGLNHLFQTSKTGLPTEYSQIEETIAPTVLTLIADWIHEQTTPR